MPAIYTTNKRLIIIILVLVLLAYFCHLSFARTDPRDPVFGLAELAKRAPSVVTTKEKIILKNGVLWCTGENPLAEICNRAAEEIEKANYNGAVKILTENMKKAPLFFPFRYNLGVSYLFLRNYDLALLNLNKARVLVPEFSKTYIQIGRVYNNMNNERKAIDFYREALARNSQELDTFILIGDIYFERNQIQLAKRHYEASLQINPKFINGLIGLAKIHFIEGRYTLCLLRLKTIELVEPYDKSYHFYFAEASFKLKDFQTAKEQYNKLLEFPNDPFFINNSRNLIIFKRELSKKFLGEDDLIQ